MKNGSKQKGCVQRERKRVDEVKTVDGGQMHSGKIDACHNVFVNVSYRPPV